MKLLGRLILGSAMVTTLNVSCGKSKSKDDNPGASNNPPSEPGLVGSGVKSLDDLKGFWRSECKQLGGGLFALSHQIREIKFDGNRYTVSVASFTDGTCNPESMNKLMIATGTIAITPDNSPTTQVNFTEEGAMLVPFTPEVAATLNTGTGTCGKSDWIEGEAADIFGNTCDYRYTLGYTAFDIMQIIDGKFYLGAYYDSNGLGKTAETRTPKIAKDEPYQKATEPMFEVTPQ